MLVPAGRLADLPTGTCVAVADGAAVVVRTDDSVVAFVNRCLHQDSPLTGGWVRDGVLSCPLHFWRYRVEDGSHIGGCDRLAQLPVHVTDGEVHVDVPAPEPSGSLREALLARARTYDRDREWRERGPQR